MDSMDFESRFPGVKKNDVCTMQEWLSNQCHLPKISESKLALFLIKGRNSLDTTKKCIEDYYTIRSNEPAIFRKRNPHSQELLQQIQMVLIHTLPQCNKDGSHVAFLKLMDDDVQKYKCAEHVKIIDMFASMHIHRARSFSEHTIVMDFNGLTFRHLMKVNFMLLKKYAHFFQEALPIHFKGIHLLHVSPVVQLLIKLCMPLLHAEYRNKLYLHSSVDSLYDHVSKGILPKECGGNAGTFKELQEQGIKIITDNARVFEEEEANCFITQKTATGKKSDTFNADETKNLDID